MTTDAGSAHVEAAAARLERAVAALERAAARGRAEGDAALREALRRLRGEHEALHETARGVRSRLDATIDRLQRILET